MSATKKRRAKIPCHRKNPPDFGFAGFVVSGV
jgi:hypothetical protein